MSVYLISDIKVHDWDKYEEYVEKARPIVESYGGHYHIRRVKSQFEWEIGNPTDWW